MNLQHIITEIEATDPEFSERISPRRQALKDFTNIGGKLALAAIPVALGSIFKKAYGQQTPSGVVDILNFALTLEYLEATFYEMGNAKGASLVPGSKDRAALSVIGMHEKQHVAFLRGVISSLGGTPVEKPAFDFSGGNGSGNGPFAQAFNNYQLFLAVAQTLEDTGVRAYKGQAPNLKGQRTVLTAALNIHSVEGRHASHIRQMRKNNGFGEVKPWITGNDTGGIGALVQANYNGEENTVQAGIEIKGINGEYILFDDASESFDEPLSKDQVIALITPFLA